MKLGEVVNGSAAANGKPLDGVRVLALEQMQALPYATQLLARLGATVVKIENPVDGDLARSSQPAMADPDGAAVGATFLRNNLSKQSICIDLKSAAGRELVLQLAPRFDIVAENFKSGSLATMGLGYDDIRAVHPAVIYLSISGFGNTTPSPYRGWPAYAAIAEAMSGLYDWKRELDRPPVVGPSGGLGDIGTALFGVIGVLAALRHRDATGIGQHVDVAMFDSMVAFADVVFSYWSMGQRPDRGEGVWMIMDGFESGDGWFVVFVNRERDFATLAQVIGCEQWLTDPRFATRQGWRAHIEEIRRAVNAWARPMSNLEACRALASAGVAAGPCLSAQQVIDDPHIAERSMLVEVDRTDGVSTPVLVPGNPIKMSQMTEGPEHRVPWLGEHTNEVLRAELGIAEEDLDALRAAGVIR